MEPFGQRLEHYLPLFWEIGRGHPSPMNYLNLLNYDTPRELTMVDLPKGHRDHSQSVGHLW